MKILVVECILWRKNLGGNGDSEFDDDDDDDEDEEDTKWPPLDQTRGRCEVCVANDTSYHKDTVLLFNF